jgi:AcrR family transcriptional regulator
MSAVAARAGVTRATVYRHFPTEGDLFAACSAEWLAQHPRPEPIDFTSLADPYDRLAAAIDATYAWYREDARMRANLIRDADVFPDPIRHGIRAFPANLADTLIDAWPTSARAPGRRAAIDVALAFATWQTLVAHGLGDTAARELVVGFVRSA